MTNLDCKTHDVSDTLRHLVEEIVGVHVNDFLVEHGSGVIASFYDHSVVERSVTEFLEEGCFRVSDFLSSSADFEIFGDLDLCFLNLGGDLESMEEVDLGGIKTSSS